MKQSRTKQIVTICTIAGIVLILALALVAVGNIIDDPGRTLFGYHLFFSDSNGMREFDSGDLLAIKPVDPTTLAAGDIIAFLSSDGRIVVHAIRSCTVAGGQPGFVTYATGSDKNDENVVLYDDVLGKYDKVLPAAGTLFGFLKEGETGGTAGHATLPTQDATEHAADALTQPVTTEAATVPETTEAPTEPAAQPAEITTEALAKPWRNARRTFGPLELDGPDEELLTQHALDLRADGTVEDTSFYYIRIDPDTWQMGDPCYLVEGTYWGIPSMGFPYRTGTWSYADGKLTINFDYDMFFDTPATTVIYPIELIDGELYVAGERFVSDATTTQALCDAFGIANQ